MGRKSNRNRLPKPGNLPNQGRAGPRAIDSGGATLTCRRAWGVRPGVQNPYTVLAVCGFLLLAVALVFGQTAGYDFVNYDDAEGVYQNRLVTGELTLRGVLAVFTQRHVERWVPLTCVSHILVWHIFGPSPAVHHLTNVFLHAVTTILLFLVLWRMTGNLWPSALVAVVFAAHPLRAESVAWVTERKDVLSGLFFVLTLAAYVRYARRRFSLLGYLAVVVCFTLSLVAKPMAVTLPFLLLLLDYWPLGRMKAASPRWGDAPQGKPAFPWRLVVEKIPLLLLTAIFCIATALVQAEIVIVPTEVLPLHARIANALISCVAYLGQFFYPAGLAVLYPHPGANLPAWKPVAALLVLAGISAAIPGCWRRKPYLFVGWLWYLGMLVPVSGLVQVGWHAMADRYTYLPQIGLCIALAWGTTDAAGYWPYRGWVLGIASTLVLAALLACAWRQTTFWRDSEALWTRTLRCTSRNAVAHCGLGAALMRRGQIDDALAHYQDALKINSDYAEAHNNLAIALASRGRIDEAIANYQDALRIKPDYAEAHNNLAVALASRGQIDEAMTHYQEALKIAPDYAEAHCNLGTALAKRGRTEEAMPHFQKAVEIQRDYAEAHCNLGVILASRGRIKEAIEHYQKALESQPDLADALNNLAWLRATRPEAAFRDATAAVALAQRAMGLSGGQAPEVLDTLAAAYAEAGMFSKAKETVREALVLARQQKKAALVDTLQARLRLYEAGTPYREAPQPSPSRSALPQPASEQSAP